MKVLVAFGTRPEIVKLAPVIRALRARGFDVTTVATGQHYDPALTDVFYAALGVKPDVEWELAGDDAQRVGEILTRATRLVGEQRPDLVVTLGDTHTVPLFSLASRRHGVPAVHVEAGLRSFNETSMEEVNRKVADTLASLHLAPTEQAARFLLAEGVEPKRIRVVGNPVIDVLQEMEVSPVPPSARAGIVVTAHRATNVDDPERLDRLVQLLRRLAEELGPVTFPVHPRTRRRLEDGGHLPSLVHPQLRLLDPVPYDQMLRLVSGALVVVTDSGGLQEEASWLGVPVVVLRHSTPRWEGVRAGTSVLTGLDVELVVAAVRRFCDADEQARVAAAPCPYGDGRAAARIADVLADPDTSPLLRMEEPDFVGREAPA